MQQIYEYEHGLLIKPQLPTGPSKLSFGKKKEMTEQNLKEYAKYLHIIFSCPALLMEDVLYEILDIQQPKIILLLKALALQKLKTVQYAAMQHNYDKFIKDPTKLRKKPFKFHTLWIVKKPLNNATAKFLGCDHWAMKFEGICLYLFVILLILFVF